MKTASRFHNPAGVWHTGIMTDFFHPDITLIFFCSQMLFS